MNTLNWIVFAVVLSSVYLSNVLIDRCVHKQWRLKVSLLACVLMFSISAALASSADIFANEYVKIKIPCEWIEQVVSTQEAEDIVRGREKEGSFFFGFGNVYERETFRYTSKRKDGLSVREKIYTADCYILKADNKRQKVVYLKNVRVYKNPEDKKFFGSSMDVTKGFYKVYLL